MCLTNYDDLLYNNTQRGTQYNLMYADPQRLRALVSLYFILK